MNQIRQRMIQDMDLAGLSERSQKTYLQAVDRLASKVWRNLEDLTEDELRTYILDLRDSGVAKGTFKTNWHGVKFFFEQTLNRDWGLLGKKRSDSRDKSASPSF